MTPKLKINVAIATNATWRVDGRTPKDVKSCVVFSDDDADQLFIASDNCLKLYQITDFQANTSKYVIGHVA